MKRCSHWTFILGMLLLPLIGVGQSFPVDGFLFDSSGGPISGTAVNLEYPLPNGGWALDSALTDPTGYFDFGTINTTSQGAMLLYAPCSFTSSVLDTLLFDPTTTGWTATLTCAPVSNGPCTAAMIITHTPNPLNPYLYWIQPVIGNNGPGTNYFFNYGNGNTGYSGGSSQSYPGPGVYTVCLTVTNGNCIDTVCQTITVGNPNGCNSNFFSWTSQGTTYFAADSLFNSGSTSYFWDFGDGTTSTGNFTNHNYALADSYLVCLVVTDPLVPCSDTTCQWIVASGQPCSVDGAISAISGDTVSFQATTFSTGGPFSFFWDFGDGTTSTQPNPTHIYTSPGSYNACVTMSSQTCASTDCVPVFIQGSACNASFTYNSWQGTTYFMADTTFANGSTNYVWNFGDGTIKFGPNNTHNYAQADTYYVCLIVTDPTTGCSDSTCQWVYSTGSSSGCVANFAYYVAPGTNDVSFTPLTSGPNAIDSVMWSFGDGNSSTAITPTHTYAGPGYYQVCIDIFYNGGCFATDCQTVYVPAGLCNSNFTAFPISSSGYFFTAIDSLLPPSSYSWTLGDGTTASGPYVSHTYNTADTFEVCLIVTDTASNCSDTTCQYVVTSGPAPSCQAAFSYQISALGQVHFVNQSTGVTPNSSFFWDLGDGNTSVAINPVYTYAAPGTYTVCLAIVTPTCVDSFCQTIVIGNTPGCDATFTASTNPTGGVTVFNAVNPVQGAVYILDPGDGSAPVFGFPPLTHVYTASGTYTPCLTVIDSLTGCTATYCDSVMINVGTPTNCQADFSYFPAVGNNTFLFLDSSFAPGPQIFYAWDFGDGNTSTQQDPVHTFTTPGPWLVCLTISDGLGCSDSICQVVQPANIPGTYSVNGVVVTDSLLGTQSIVYLIEHDNVLNTLTAIDSQFAAFGYYQFNNVQPGTYLVKAGLTPASPQFANYLPTYHGDVMTWNTAISTVVTNSNVWNLPITLVQGNNPGGPAFIGGLISQGANKNGDPLPNISVLLMTIDEDPVTHTITNEDGEYEFPNLAYGTYIVHVEVAGKVAEDWVVTLDANNPSFTIGDFDVHTDHIDAVGTTSIANGLDPASVRVYPNPSSGVLNIALDLEENAARIELRNSLGAIIETVETNSGSVTRQLDLSSLASGVYLIQVSTENGSVSHRVMKK